MPPKARSPCEPALRRSARIAAKNVAKNATGSATAKEIFTPADLSASAPSFTILAGPGQGGKSPLHEFLKTPPRLFNTGYDHKPLPVNNGWHLEYDLFRDEMPTMSPEILSETLEFHKRNHSGDEWHAKQTCPERWKQELYPASRWFCVDSRLFLESEEMREKSKIHAYTVNRNLPSLYAHIAYLEVQVRRTTGRQADVARHELLMTKLLRELADHAHSTWNEWNIEFDELNREPFKPEMPIDSDDENW